MIRLTGDSRTDHTSGCSRYYRVIGDVREDDRVRADDGSDTDADAGSDEHVLAQPGPIAYLDRRDPIDPLVEDRDATLLKRVRVVGDVDVAREENLSAEPYGAHRGQDARPDHAGPVADVQKCAAFVLGGRRRRPQPATWPDEHAGADADSRLSFEANRWLDDARASERRERPTDGETESFARATPGQAIEAEKTSAEQALQGDHYPMIGSVVSENPARSNRWISVSRRLRRRVRHRAAVDCRRCRPQGTRLDRLG